MTNNVELWIVDEDDNTILLIEERRRCPVHNTPLDDDGTCEQCGGLNWTIFS